MEEQQQPYAPEVRQLAREVWTFHADRNAAKTVRILAESHSVDVSVESVRRWARSEHWIERAPELYQQQSPDLFHQSRFTLVASAPDAARYLTDLYRHNLDGSPVIAKPDRIRMQAAVAVLQGIGSLPSIRADIAALSAPSLRAIADGGDGGGEVASLDIEQLRRLAAHHVTEDGEG